MSRKSSRKSGANGYFIGFLVGLVVVIAAACFLVWLVFTDFIDIGGASATPAPAAHTLRVAYSPEKERLFTALINAFNSQGLSASDGVPLRVEGVPMEPRTMVEAALNGEFQALSPDSSLWLSQIERAWDEHTGGEGTLIIGQSVRYAVSPVVIIMWRDVAESLGWPQAAIGWDDLMQLAQAQPDFAWSHASTSTTSGLLATLAEFYAGAGKTRSLTIQDVQSQQTLDFVTAIERTVRFYGQGEWDVARQIDVQMKQDGTRYLDAFVGQEQLVLYLNDLGHDVVAIYPAEGAMWADHPLALLENQTLSDAQRLTFQRFAAGIAAQEAQQTVIAAGYRPADLDIDLMSEDSPFTGTDAVDPTQPRTGLQIPGAQVVEVVKDVYWYTKRPTDVYLVVDTSGSMEGEKMERTRDALYAFLEGIRGDRDRVGLVEFYGEVKVLTALERTTPDYRSELQRHFGSLLAGGETALLDGVLTAYGMLQKEGNREHISAIVVMTDGVENASRISLSRLTQQLSLESDVPVVVFAIAYGDDADYNTLEAIVSATNGRVWEGTPETIRNLYQIISTYF